MNDHRIIVLDGYEISSIEGLDQEKTDEANRYLGEHNPNDFKTFGVNWSDGLDGTNKRFMPYNGMLGMQQMNWLKETLTQCSKDGEYAIIFTHIPLHPSAADNLCLLWNYQVKYLTLDYSNVTFRRYLTLSINLEEYWQCWLDMIMR